MNLRIQRILVCVFCSLVMTFFVSAGMLASPATATNCGLQEERERGYFDEEGNYVEHEDKDKDEEADAWLLSDEGKGLSRRLLFLELQFLPTNIDIAVGDRCRMSNFNFFP